MIDTNKALQAFKEKFAEMSCAEREQYLKDMGFVFDVSSASKPARKHTGYNKKAHSQVTKILKSRKKQNGSDDNLTNIVAMKTRY